MEVYIKKYFWVLGVVVVALCAALTAKGVNHVVEAKFLADPEKAPPTPPPAVPTTKKKQRNKIGAAIADRNIFCSDCQPPEEELPAADTPTSGSGVPLTGLPLRLLATQVATREKFSFATIANSESSKQGYYAIGDAIPGAGEILRIRGKYVDFQNERSRRVERIELLSKNEPAKPAYKPPARAPVRPTGGPKDEISQMIDKGVNKTGDNSYDIDRSLVDKVLENPAVVARGARIVPSIRNGKPNGFKLYAIRPNSIYSKIGLMNGDTIHVINGFELTTADKALEVYTKVREANSLTVQATWRGKPITLTYSIK